LHISVFVYNKISRLYNGGSGALPQTSTRSFKLAINLPSGSINRHLPRSDSAVPKIEISHHVDYQYDSSQS
jgi:hypothetical protein